MTSATGIWVKNSADRGFTLLEMMLVLLVIGSAASLVMMSFPTLKRDTASHQLARFQAQLEFAVDESQQTGQVLGIQVRPEAWTFQILTRRKNGGGLPQNHSDVWQGYYWQAWQPRHSGLQQQQRGHLTMQRGDRQPWPAGSDSSPEPDVLLLPGGEITPFTLTFHDDSSDADIWLKVDDGGTVTTSLNAEISP